MKNHRHASCCFCARQTFIVVRKEVIFIHISRYTFCTRSCIFIGAGEKGERRARATRARAYPLAIKDGETLFKPDTALEIRPCSDHEIPSVEHNRYSPYTDHGRETTRRVATLRRLISSGRLKTNGRRDTMKTYFALFLSFVRG